MKVNVEENVINIERPSDNKLHRSLHGTTRSVIANMVATGFGKWTPQARSFCVQQ